MRQGLLPLDAIPAAAFRVPVKIRFGHCDPAGIVYFPRYLDIINGVIEDFFTEGLGCEYREIIRDRGIGLGPAHIETDFQLPGFQGDTIDFAVLVDRVGNSSLALSVHAHRGDEPVLRARLILVTTSLEFHRSVPIPGDVREALQAYEDRCR